MGQNMVAGAAPRHRTRRHGEAPARRVLDKNGNFYTANLRTAQQTDNTRCVVAPRTFEPHFTFHGFRFVKVEGLPGAATPEAITGVVVHSDMPRTGAFASSDTMLNQLYHNIVWGQKGNFVGVPTDCPQRDERLGWTGDAQVFSRTAAFNFDVAGFFTNWLRDLAADQRQNGSLPDVIPDVLSRGRPTGTSSAGWGDATVVVPWTMYLTYGDKRLLENQYPSMRAYVEYQRKTAGDKLLWNTGWHYGDWLAFATTSADYPGATTDKDLIATAFYAHSTDLLARSAQALGKTEDARNYHDLYERIRAAWTKELSARQPRRVEHADGVRARVAVPSSLISCARRGTAARRERPRHRPPRRASRHAVPHRCAHGERPPDEAYRLLMNKKYPSWLYPITQGRRPSGNVGRKARQQLPGRRHEFVQPLRVRRHRRLDGPHRRGLDLDEVARLQASSCTRSRVAGSCRRGPS
jgi:alpha-L-rhamnosidase